MIGHCTSPGTCTGTCRFIHGKTCTDGLPVYRYLVRKIPASTGISSGSSQVPVQPMHFEPGSTGSHTPCFVRHLQCSYSGCHPKSSSQEPGNLKLLLLIEYCLK